MPIKEISEEDEGIIDKWLRMRTKNGMSLRLDSIGNVNEATEAQTLIDEYRLEEKGRIGALILYTDIHDRMRLNRLICSNWIADEMESDGVWLFGGAIGKD